MGIVLLQSQCSANEVKRRLQQKTKCARSADERNLKKKKKHYKYITIKPICPIASLHKVHPNYVQ